MRRADPGASPTVGRLATALNRSWARPEPDALARLLQPLAMLYGLAWAGREWLYRRQWRPVEHLAVPVLVVGNLVAGGAGKTPTVLALVPRLRALGFRPGVVSRGHGRASGAAIAQVTADTPAAAVGDEPLLIHRRTGVPVAVGRDRVAAGRALCQAHPEVNLLIADDGLQHHRLARDAQVLVFDDRGAGNGLLLPAGPLRQPMPHAVPPDSLVLYTAGRPSTALPGTVGHRRLVGALPLEDWWAGARLPAPGLTDDPWAPLRGRPLLAAAGLARPEAFFQMLEAAGLAIQRCPLPDHAPLWPLPWPDHPPDVVVTEKDAVKLPPACLPPGGRIWVATLDFQPEPAFDTALQRLCAPLLPARWHAPASATPHQRPIP